MTTANEKVRSLFLAALMVFSVFGGTVALSGGAAALTAGNAAPASTAANADTTLTTSAEIESDKNLEGVQLEFDIQSADSGFSPDSDDYTVVIENSDGSQQASLSGQDITVTEGSVTVTFDGQSVQDGDIVELQAAGYQNPSTDGTYDGTFQVNPNSNGESTSVSLGIGDGTGIDVTDLDAPRVAAHDQDITVTANVTNTGGSEVTADVDYQADSTIQPGTVTAPQQSYTLAAGETREVSFTVNTAELPGNDANAAVDYTHGITATTGADTDT